MNVRRLLPAVLLSVLVASAGTTAARSAWAAPDEPEAEALIGKGIELREKGKDDEALAVFKQALARSPSPRARAQVALAEQALGLWVAAESDLAQALAQGEDAWIAKNKAALEGALGTIRRRLGSLEVRGTEGADVSLDGVKLGTLPAAAPFRVEAGRRTLELRAKGFHPTARTIEVPAGGIARETVTLVALPPESASPGNGAGAARPENGRPERAEGDPGKTQRLLGWIFTGTGGALLATGGVSFLVRNGIIDDFNTQCDGVGAANASASCQDKESSTKTWLYVGVSTLIAGGVLAIGGLTLALTAPSASGARTADGSTPARTGLRASCSPSSFGVGGASGAGGGLFCAGSF